MVDPAVTGVLRDERLLCGERFGLFGAELADPFTGGQQLMAGALGEGTHTHCSEHLVGDSQPGPGIDAAADPAQPFPVEQVCTSEFGSQTGPAEPVDGFPIQRVGGLATTRERRERASRHRPASVVDPSQARDAGECGPAQASDRHRIADKGYDYPSVYSELRQRHITGYIARRGTRDKVTAGRWIVEQSFALLYQYQRPTIRWERRTDIHHGFPDLAALICWRPLGNRTHRSS
ncbi:hypothetical protein [Nocardia sp. NPDC004860]|uniref:hypothetical protein n=1 Tax=Nocardia sp. NPDC004860 TaxID=3154557 RepID=UPI0033B4B513